MNWEDLSFPAQLGIVAGFAVAVVAAFYFFYIQGVNEQIDITKRQINELNDSIEEGKRMTARLSQFEEEVKKLEDKFELFKEIIPNTIEYHVLLKYFETVASETSIVVKVMNPGAKQAKGFYAEYPILIQAIGSYHNLIRFFQKVKNLKRIININGMVLQRRKIEQNDQDVDKPINIKFYATTFMFVEPAKPGARPGAARPGGQPPARPPAGV